VIAGVLQAPAQADQLFILDDRQELAEPVRVALLVTLAHFFHQSSMTKGLI
jgi:hypothetical protein